MQMLLFLMIINVNFFYFEVCIYKKVNKLLIMCSLAKKEQISENTVVTALKDNSHLIRGRPTREEVGHHRHRVDFPGVLLVQCNVACLPQREKHPTICSFRENSHQFRVYRRRRYICLKWDFSIASNLRFKCYRWRERDPKVLGRTAITVYYCFSLIFKGFVILEFYWNIKWSLNFCLLMTYQLFQDNFWPHNILINVYVSGRQHTNL